MLNIKEAKSGVKALFFQAASLSGLEVTAESPERFVELIDEGFSKITPNRQPEVVANLLKVIAATLMYAQENNILKISESTVDEGKEKVCPVYPFNQ